MVPSVLRILAQTISRRTGISCFLLYLAWWPGTAILGAEPVDLAPNSGIRTLRSKHLTLYTDLPSQPAIDELPLVFDLAVPEWARIFKIPVDRLASWHVEGSLIQNKSRFRQHGLLPPGLPDFLNGFQKVNQVWVYEQPSDYYRRHLLLHEGTHSVVNRIFGQVGPIWYREGLAELIATHQYRDGKLRLGSFPKDKKLVEYWGRIRIVKDELRKGKTRSIRDIVGSAPREYLKVEAYAWSWALQAFGHAHPKYRSIFEGLRSEMYFTEEAVTREFLEDYEAARPEIDIAWNLFLDQLDYGYDARHEQVEHVKDVRPLPRGGATISIDVAKGWQSTGLRVAPGTTVAVRSQGRFQLAADKQIWWSEPQGVTIQYYQGRPLGQLIGAFMRSGETSGGALSQPFSIGHRRSFSTEQGGVLYLRVNERADRMGDNRGRISVEISPKSAGLQ